MKKHKRNLEKLSGEGLAVFLFELYRDPCYDERSI